MTKRLHSIVVCVILILSLGSVAFCADVERVDPPSAPIPPQILSAKKIFIANGGSEVQEANKTIPINYHYNRFYAEMKGLGRFDLVSNPAEADLVFEIRFITVLPHTVGGNAAYRTYRQLDLLIIDPKTRVTLWRINEQFDSAKWDSNKRKDLDNGIWALVNDLKALLGIPLPPPPPEPEEEVRSVVG